MLIAFAPMKSVPEKRNGQWSERQQSLLPGYLFLYNDEETTPLDLPSKVHHLYTVLQYEKGIKALTGSDKEYAEWIYRHHGEMQVSHVLTVGNTIQVINGPLMDCQGTIIKLDKHKRRAWIEFTFDGQKRVISMGAECISG